MNKVTIRAFAAVPGRFEITASSNLFRVTKCATSSQEAAEIARDFLEMFASRPVIEAPLSISSVL